MKVKEFVGVLLTSFCIKVNGDIVTKEYNEESDKQKFDIYDKEIIAVQVHHNIISISTF